MDAVIPIVLVVVVGAVVMWMMRASSGPPDSERYCLKCSKITQWHPTRGCQHCEWCERQW